MDQQSNNESLGANQDYPLLQHIDHITAEVILTEILMTERRVALIILDRNGTIILANKFAARGYRQASPLGVIGKNLRDFTPPEWADERIGIVNQCLETDQAIILLQIAGGYRLRLRFVPVHSPGRDPEHSCVLVTGEEIKPSSYDKIISDEHEELVVHSEFINLGPLDVLSNRELEVLALMGQGFRSKDIAKTLFRSVSTIENHRDKIGLKLGLKDRGKIIEQANLASLQVEDASRKRIQIPFLSSRKIHNAPVDRTKPID